MTQTERTLLANVRQMERYRRGFYVEIMTGVSTVPGRPAADSLAGSGGGGSVAVGGFLRLLQTEQEIRNQEDNVNALRSNYFRLLVTLHELMRKLQLADDSGSPSADEENIARQRLQVAQARQAALNAESRLLTAQAAFQTALDRFKLDLGLPPTICVKISDPLLDRVNVIDPAIRPIQAQVSDLQQRMGDVILELLPEAGGELIWSEQVAQNLRTLRDRLDAVEPIRQALMDGDQAQIQRVREDGLELGRKLQAAFERALAGHADDDPQLAELRRDADLLQRVLARFDEPRADWIERVTEFARLRDALADLDRMQQQLVQGGAIELGWMGTDPNRRTRRLYQRSRSRPAAVERAGGRA